MKRSRNNVYTFRRVKKMLVFEGGRFKSTDVVDLSDNETEKRSEKESDRKDTLEERSVSENYEDEDVEDAEVNTRTPLSGRKRKLVITSDSENDDDEDNIPISILKNLKPPNRDMPDLVDTPSIRENGSRRLARQCRVRKQRVLEEIFTTYEQNSTQRIPITSNVEDDNDAEEESDRDSDSLDGFIVEDDDSQETHSENSDETGGEEEESDGESCYADVISRLRRDKNPEKRKWDYEADMLADFGKDPELCMKAVCVLYRLQTEGEKATRSSHVTNCRGFSNIDAPRGTRIGNFLMDGDSESEMKKTVEELRSFEYKGVEICEDLARKYSKQLFQIYRNREDRFFAAPPSP